MKTIYSHFDARYCAHMLNFEFNPSNQYLDSFVSQHSILVRGINPKLGVEKANSLIRQVFGDRFGERKVISVHTVRRSDKILSLYRKRRIYKQRLEQYQMQNHYQENREVISVSKKHWCSKRVMDAEDYFQKKYDEVQAEWEKVKKSSQHENVGMAFVSFKDKLCVTETIDELDVVKSTLVDKAHYIELQIQNWEVEMAYHSSDIIWSELNKGFQRSIFTKIVLNLIPLIISIFVVASLFYLD